MVRLQEQALKNSRQLLHWWPVETKTLSGLTVWPTRSLRPIWPIFRHTSREPFKITLLSCWIENSAFLGVHWGLWTSQDWEPVFNQRNIFHGQPGYWGILNDSHEWDSSLPFRHGLRLSGSLFSVFRRKDGGCMWQPPGRSRTSRKEVSPIVDAFQCLNMFEC